MGPQNTYPRRWYWDLGLSNGCGEHCSTKVVLGFGWFVRGPNKKFDPSPKEASPVLKFTLKNPILDEIWNDPSLGGLLVVVVVVVVCCLLFVVCCLLFVVRV